jgi:hypothetical protein
LTEAGAPILRKTSAHGLGHWLPPYADDEAPVSFPRPAVPLEGVRRWQHDIWHRIVTAALAETDTTTNPAAHRAFDRPVASSYHATKPSILGWFKRYNEGRPLEQQVHPFNFLLSFQIDPLAHEAEERPKRRRRGRRRSRSDKIRPVAPYDKNPVKAARNCFDRETGEPVPIEDLETYREALAQYHVYPENKFLNGRYTDRGPTQRRHIRVDATDVHYIGKEAHELEEQVFFGFDPEAQPDYGMEAEAYAGLLARVQDFLKRHKLADVSAATRISVRYLRQIRDGSPNVRTEMLKRIESASPALEAAHTAEQAREQELLDWARAERDRIGLRALASRLRTDPANLGKVLGGRRRATVALLTKIVAKIKS